MKRPVRGLLIATALGLLVARAAHAGQADVLEVKVTRTAAGTYDFAVTVRHADTGWDHYADRWEVLSPDGTILATRVLMHPHVDEQPVTRTLDDVRLPAGVTRVRVRAHDNVHGYGGAEKDIDLPMAPAATPAETPRAPSR